MTENIGYYYYHTGGDYRSGYRGKGAGMGTDSGLARARDHITDSYERAQTEYKGKPSNSRAKLAFFHLGQVELELIEPVGRPSTWQDQLDERGDGLHHIAFEIKGMPEKVVYLEARGCPLVQRGEYPGGRYAYLNGDAQLGTILELLEND